MWRNDLKSSIFAVDTKPARVTATKTGVDRNESKSLNSSARGWTYGHSIVDASGNDTFSGVMGSVGPVSSAQLTFMMNGGEMTIDH